MRPDPRVVRDPSYGFFILDIISLQPYIAQGGLCKFYKVDSLAVATRLFQKYQGLFFDGIRILTPQGYLKYLSRGITWVQTLQSIGPLSNWYEYWITHVKPGLSLPPYL